MKWLLVFLPFWVKGQCLKPGTYHNLKPTEPLVLDTGTYTFIQLEMKDLNSGTWLDARTARKLELIGCSFIGNGEGTAVVSSGDLVVSSSVFSRLACAVHYQAIGHRQVKVYRNTFTDNETSIWLSRKDGITEVVHLDFTLKCNRFEHDATDLVSRRGLVIGEGVALRAPNNLTGTSFLTDQIGGAAGFNSNGTAYPNANVWPTGETERDEFPEFPPGNPVNVNDEAHGWANSPNWVSIENHTSNSTVKYWRFNNEFVGRGNNPFSGPVALDYIGQSVVTGNQTEDDNHKKACLNLFDQQGILFPARIAVVDSQIVMQKGADVFDEAWLENPEPNPAQKEVRIRLHVPQKVQVAFLQIVELSTGKILQTITLDKKGVLDIFLNVSNAVPGIYGYRLVGDGISLPPKKLMIEK